MHSHCRNGQSLRGIGSSYRRVILSHHRKVSSQSLAVPAFCRKMTFHSNDGRTFCGQCSSIHRKITSFRRMMSVNRRMIHVQRHDERVHLANVHSQRGIGRTQCRKMSSREQNGSCYPRNESVNHRKLCVNRRMKIIFRGKGDAESRVVRAFWPWEERS